jgi:RNA polymerase sigma-70 factor (ECF subfamily)
MTAQSRAATAGVSHDPLAQLIADRAYRDAVGLAARRHGEAIGRLCMALLGSQAEAEEAAQEALIAAYDAMASYRGEGSVKAWLMGIARRICARRLETRTRQQSKLRLVYDASSEASQAPDDLLEKRRMAERIRAALESLRPSEREALVLRYGADLSFRELGEACGIDEATARKRASRALNRLRAVLAGE